MHTVKLLGVIFTDPEVINMVTELTIKVIEEKKVIEVRTKKNAQLFQFLFFSKLNVIQSYVFYNRF